MRPSIANSPVFVLSNTGKGGGGSYTSVPLAISLDLILTPE